MNWTDITTKLPEKKGAYIVSISRQHAQGQYVFSYVAYFDRDNNKWHKYNPFVDSSVEEEITDRVIGWVENSSTYLGLVS